MDKKKELMPMLEIELGGSPKPGKEAKKEYDSEEDQDTTFEAFATDAFDALQSGDVGSFVEALRGALECM